MTFASTPKPRLARDHKALALAATLFGVSVSGCAVGPDYVAPTISLADFHSVGALPARRDDSPPLDRWWTGFDDPTLTRIIRRALDQNLDLAASLARVEQARAAAREAGAKLLPTTDATAQAVKIRQSLESPVGAIGRNLPGYDPNQALFDLGISSSWEIDVFGGLRRGAEAASAEAEAAEAARLGTRISVAADAADAYFQIRGDQAQIAATEGQIATDAHLLDLVRQRSALGLASARETAQAEALLYQARSALPPLRVDLEAQLNRLDVLMGAQPGTYAAELRAPANIPAVSHIFGGDKPIDVLRRRPDVIAAERRLASSNARIGEAISGYYPKISISGLLGFESMNVSHLFRSATFQPQAVAGLRWRLFDFGKIDSEVAQAEGAHAEALARYRQSILRAAEDVENAFTAFRQSRVQTKELEAEISAVKRALALAQSAYRAGGIPLTDVLDANRQLLIAKSELARSRADTARAAVRVFRALGGNARLRAVIGGDDRRGRADGRSAWGASTFALHNPVFPRESRGWPSFDSPRTRRAYRSACYCLRAGVQAIGDAARLIRNHEADIAVCGGAEACINIVSLGSFAAARSLSTAFNDTPTKASRPFDMARDGFVMGEGARILPSAMRRPRPPCRRIPTCRSPTSKFVMRSLAPRYSHIVTAVTPSASSVARIDSCCARS